jgi:hypothetical protein
MQIYFRKQSVNINFHENTFCSSGVVVFLEKYTQTGRRVRANELFFLFFFFLQLSGAHAPTVNQSRACFTILKSHLRILELQIMQEDWARLRNPVSMFERQIFANGVCCTKFPVGFPEMSQLQASGPSLSVAARRTSGPDDKVSHRLQQARTDELVAPTFRVQEWVW